MIIKNWKPKKVRFEHYFKKIVVLKLDEKKSIDVIYGTFGLKALESNILKYEQLESARRSITRLVKRKNKIKNSSIYIRVKSNIPLTKKPTGVRMGKGKGKISEWVSKVKAGMILIELKGVNSKLAKDVLRMSGMKLPLKTTVIKYKI